MGTLIQSDYDSGWKKQSVQTEKEKDRKLHLSITK